MAFANKLVNGIATPFIGPKVCLVMSSSASDALVGKVEKKVRGATLHSLKEGMPALGKGGVCVFLTPSSQRDYQAARTLAKSGCATVLVNGSFKVRHVANSFADHIIELCAYLMLHTIQ